MATVDLQPTICSLFFATAAREPDRPALQVARGERLCAVPWSELRRDVLQLAAGLRQAGLQPGDRVAQIAENRYEWLIADLAILAARGVHVPIHASLSGAQMAQQIAHSGANFALLAGQSLADALAPHRPSLPDVRFFVYDDWPGRAQHPLAPQPLAALREAVTPTDEQAAARRTEEIEPHDLATIMYTSGTLGEPKGVMLSHLNLASNAIATAEMYGAQRDELRLCFLPLSHIYARTCDIYTWLYRGSQLALARSRETILDDCQMVQPTLLNGVPYFYEKLYRRLEAAGKTESHDVLRTLLGGRVRTLFSGGAAMPQRVLDFFASQDLPVLEGYGLSEASPVISVSKRAAFRPGAVGQPIGGIDVRIAEDGEILARGPNVMLGYWKNEAATAAVVREGWLHTGDLGRLDDDGYLWITGRKKEILVTAAGKKVSPAYLEQLLRQSPFILQALVVGEGRKFLTALVVPDPQRLRAEIRARRLWVFSRRGALRHRRVLALYRQEIDRLLARLSHHEQIGAFTLLSRGFTIESGELTPKASLRREAILKIFAAEREVMYREGGGGRLWAARAARLAISF